MAGYGAGDGGGELVSFQITIVYMIQYGYGHLSLQSCHFFLLRPLPSHLTQVSHPYAQPQSPNSNPPTPPSPPLRLPAQAPKTLPL